MRNVRSVSLVEEVILKMDCNFGRLYNHRKNSHSHQLYTIVTLSLSTSSVLLLLLLRVKVESIGPPVINCTSRIEKSDPVAYLKKGSIPIQVFPAPNAYTNSFVVCSCIILYNTLISRG